MRDLLEFDAVVAAPFGGIGVRIDGECIGELVYLPRSFKARAPRAQLAREAVRQIRAYLSDPAFRIDLPLAERGTPFQREVWRAISALPGGATCTYGDLARHLRSAPRAVGQACGANWFSLAVPCHRVLAANGIGGFGRADDGFHMNIKRWLLAHEGVTGHARPRP